MKIVKSVIYNIGGYDESKPDNNIKEIVYYSKDEILELKKSKIEEIKIERNKRLFETDWTQLPDVDLSDKEVQEFRMYRKYLRNIMHNIDDPLSFSFEDINYFRN